MDYCNQGADCHSFFQLCISKSTRCHDEAISLLYVNHLWVGLIVIGFWNQFRLMAIAYKAPHNVALSFFGENLVPNYFAQPFKSSRKNLLKVLPPWEINGYGQKVIFIAAPTLWNVLLLVTASLAPGTRNCSKLSFSNVPWMILSPNWKMKLSSLLFNDCSCNFQNCFYVDILLYAA